MMNVVVPAGLGPGEAFQIQVWFCCHSYIDEQNVTTPTNVKVPTIPVLAPAVADDIMAVKGVFVKQKIELMEVITGYETKNKYKVANLFAPLDSE